MINEETFTDPVTEENRCFDINKRMVSELESLILAVKDEVAKKELSNALKLWEDSVNEHNL